MPNAKIIAIANLRRYVGCSTICYAMAAAKSKAKGKNMVLMIDLNPQSRLTEKCGMFQEYEAIEKFNSSELFRETSNLPQCCFNISSTNTDRLFVIPAVLNLELINNLNAEIIDNFKSNISLLQRFFDYIFICCPAQLGLLLNSALSVANEVIIPVKIDPYKTNDFFENCLCNIVENSNDNDAHISILPNSYDTKSRFQTMYLDEYMKKSKRIIGTIPFSTKIARAELQNLSIVMTNPHAKISTTFQEIAKRF